MHSLAFHLRHLALLFFSLCMTLSASIATAQVLPEARMKHFLLALDKRNAALLPTFFHPRQKIQFKSFDVGTGELLGSIEYTRAQISSQLKQRKSFARHHFFNAMDNTFRADWAPDTPLRMSPPGTFRNADVPDTFRTYIRWEKFQGSWFIVELAESLS